MDKEEPSPAVVKAGAEAGEPKGSAEIAAAEVAGTAAPASTAKGVEPVQSVEAVAVASVAAPVAQVSPSGRSAFLSAFGKLPAWAFLVALVGIVPPTMPYLASGWESAKSRVQWWLVEPRKPQEILVLVAPFEYIGNAPNNVDHQEIKRSVIDKLTKLGLERELALRVEFLPTVITAEDGPQRVVELAREKNGTLAIWGQIATNRTQFHFYDASLAEKVNDTKHGLSLINEASGRFHTSSFSLALPEATSAINFVTLWTVGRIFYYQQNFDRTNELFNEAINLTKSKWTSSEKLAGAEADGFYQIWSTIDTVRSLVSDGKPTVFSPSFIAWMRSKTTDRSVLTEYELTRRSWVVSQDPGSRSRQELLDELIALEVPVNAEGTLLVRGIYYLQRAVVFEEMNMPEKQKVALMRAMEILGLNEPAESLTLYRMVLLSSAFALNKEPERCIALLKTALAQPIPDDLDAHDAWMKLAGCHADKGQHEEALAAMDQALGKAHHRLLKARTLHGKTTLLSKLQRDDEAAEIQKEIIRVNPEYNWDRHNLALNYRRNGNLEEARRLAQEVVRRGSFFNGLKSLMEIDLLVGVDSRVILKDLRLEDLSEPIKLPADGDRADHLFMVLAATLSARDGLQFAWPQEWTKPVTGPDAGVFVTHAFFLFSELKDSSLALDYIDFMRQHGQGSPEMLMAAGYISSHEVLDAVRWGDAALAHQWLDRAMRYGHLDHAVLAQLVRRNFALQKKHSQLKATDYTAYGLPLGQRGYPRRDAATR